MLHWTATCPISPHLRGAKATDQGRSHPKPSAFSYRHSSPVALDFLAALLDVSEAAAGVALLLVGVVTIAGHVTGFAAVIATLLSFLFGLFTVSGNMATPVAIVACCV